VVASGRHLLWPGSARDYLNQLSSRWLARGDRFFRALDAASDDFFDTKYSVPCRSSSGRQFNFNGGFDFCNS
jgi:hypothetical protein